jgi:hypothetical protein
MAAAPLVLEAYKGEDYVARGTHKASRSPGAPVVDISGWTMVFTVRALPTNTNHLLEATPAIVSGPAGTYTITLTAAETLALGVGQFHCDVWRTNSGAQTEMAVGRLTILQPVRNP